jgi:hypothetical protein
MDRPGRRHRSLAAAHRRRRRQVTVGDRECAVSELGSVETRKTLERRGIERDFASRGKENRPIRDRAKRQRNHTHGVCVRACVSAHARARV